MDIPIERSAPRLVLSKETLLRGTLALMLALSCVSFIEPSPYEFFFFLLVPVALLRGLTLTRTTLALFFLIFAIVMAQLVALFPYLQHPAIGEGNLTPTIFTVYTVYLYASALLFALIFSREPQARLDICLKAYALSCIFAGLWGIGSYLDIGGLNAKEPITDRIAGPFKDPNVLGSYCVLGALYLLQRTVLGTRWRLLSFIGFLIVLGGGVFLSFSRGSWGATVFGILLMGISGYVTAADRFTRSRIRQGVIAVAVLGGLGAFAVGAVPVLRETVIDRAQLAQDYDSGETGRFGNQRRSIPMLVESPFGLGPFRFPMYFTLQPHNSYVGAFADAGWIGGFGFLLLVVFSSIFALRQMFARSPLMWQAQVICPALLAFFLQALQIDIDHWRFVFLVLGMVWGMQAALTAARSAHGLRRQPAYPDGPALHEPTA